MRDFYLDPPDEPEDDEIEYGELQERDEEAEAEVQREMDIEDFNTPRANGFAPADFVYDPLSRRGFE